MSNTYYNVPCEYCDAGIGMPCVTNAGKQTSTHKLRIEAYERMIEQAFQPLPLDVAELDAVSPEPKVLELVMPEVDVIPVIEPHHLAALIELASVMPPTVAIQPKQVLHVISGGTLGKQSRSFYPGLASGVEFSMEKHFKMHETRPYLEQHMPCEFAIVSEDDLDVALTRSEERRVGKECRSRWSPGASK